MGQQVAHGDAIVQAAQQSTGDTLAKSGVEREPTGVDQLADRDGGEQFRAGGGLESGTQ
jgi:hypothetical protein